MTPRFPGRHRAPTRLDRGLSGSAAIAASGLLVASIGATATSASPLLPAPAPATPIVSGPAHQARPAPAGLAETALAEFAQAAQALRERADQPVKAVPAPTRSEVEHSHYGQIGFTAVEPQPATVEPEAPAPVAIEQPTSETRAEGEVQRAPAESRTQVGASRSQGRAQAPTQDQATAPAIEQPAAPAAAAGGEGAIAWAQANLGLPYRWASSSGGGYDCSGFTTAAFRAAGISLPHQSEAQYHATSRVPLGQIQRGDLLFYSSNGSASGIFHVAIYLGGGQVIHSLRDWSGGFSGSKINGLNYSPGLMAAGRP